MKGGATASFDDVQRGVLAGGFWKHSQHLVLGFGADARPSRFLVGLREAALFPTPASSYPKPAMQIGLGFSRRGLERAHVPAFARAALALKAPAFQAGAAVRGPLHAGAHGASAPSHWDPAFGFETLDAVLDLHADDRATLDALRSRVERVALDQQVSVTALPRAEWPGGEPVIPFGYRDNLSRVGITGWHWPQDLKDLRDVSCHAAGEFVLGHPQNSGANPWFAQKDQVWPDGLRAFFRNASFGVLHQVEQHVATFEKFVAQAAQDTGLPAETIRAKLCGRGSDGRPTGGPADADPHADHDYLHDRRGEGCPFGAHTRRMNPRDGTPRAHTRKRPLLRRGMPYADGARQGLMGLFFCASIEDQFEHLLGQWADRVPLGSDDEGRARDPLIGGHRPGDGRFLIPRADGPPHELRMTEPFTRTRGTAYLFYPSLATLERIASQMVLPRLAEPDA